jgi:hypothetical protein
MLCWAQHPHLAASPAVSLPRNRALGDRLFSSILAITTRHMTPYPIVQGGLAVVYLEKSFYPAYPN